MQCSLERVRAKVGVEYFAAGLRQSVEKPQVEKLVVQTRQQEQPALELSVEVPLQVQLVVVENLNPYKISLFNKAYHKLKRDNRAGLEFRVIYKFVEKVLILAQFIQAFDQISCVDFRVLEVSIFFNGQIVSLLQLIKCSHALKRFYIG